MGESVIKPEQLWMSVMQAGGYEPVTAHKGWAAIGRSYNPPKYVA